MSRFLLPHILSGGPALLKKWGEALKSPPQVLAIIFNRSCYNLENMHKTHNFLFCFIVALTERHLGNSGARFSLRYKWPPHSAFERSRFLFLPPPLYIAAAIIIELSALNTGEKGGASLLFPAYIQNAIEFRARTLLSRAILF